jgi:hypothetical protein
MAMRFMEETTWPTATSSMLGCFRTRTRNMEEILRHVGCFLYLLGG